MGFEIWELLQSVIIVGGIATFLSILMVIADATIGNYGEMKLLINDEKEIVVEGGNTLLSTLKDEGVFIPSACGGRGSCGLCKVTIEDGAGDYLPTELPWISDKEKSEKIRICCQVKVKQDMKLTIDPELFNIKEFDATVSEIIDLTYDTKQFKLTFDEEINFKAGQFVQLEVPEYELTDEPVYRAYSIASVPSDKKSLELQIKYVPNGICTTYLHNHLKSGDKIIMNGPYGDFYLSDTQSDIILMAVGSGMAPMRSILMDMAEKGNQRKITYLFGVRAQEDLFSVEELREIEKKLPNFKFVPALSRPKDEDNWKGEVGRLTDLLPTYILDPSNTEAYLCAGEIVINSYRASLVSNGIAEEKIYYDSFG